MRMWKEALESQNLTCLYVKAWKKDLSNDTKIAFLGEFEALEKHILPKNNNYKKYINKAKKIHTDLARRAKPLAGKIPTYGELDIDKLINAYCLSSENVMLEVFKQA